MSNPDLMMKSFYEKRNAQHIRIGHLLGLVTTEAHRLVYSRSGDSDLQLRIGYSEGDAARIVAVLESYSLPKIVQFAAELAKESCVMNHEDVLKLMSVGMSAVSVTAGMFVADLTVHLEITPAE